MSLELPDKLVVAVHGMGDMKRGDFAQALARLFARYYQGASSQVNRLPCGAWSPHATADIPRDDEDPIAIHFFPAEGATVELARYSFAEVYWAHLPRKVAAERYTVEDTTSWARSVVGRLRHRYGAGEEDQQRFRLAATVVEEIAETLRVLTRLLAWAEKAGIFRFDLGVILLEYLGDVQQVADFPGERERIVRRICEQFSKLHRANPKADIHIVAHSEGTVVTFCAMLRALLATSEAKAEFDWIKRVRSLSTFGSPIDKHLILFPEMWDEFRAPWRRLEGKIRWFNYYDLADPVGFELDTAYDWITARQCNAFDIPSVVTGGRPRYPRDIGFRRYALPGKAHIDYFGDDLLFAHVIENAIAPAKPDTIEPPPIRTAWWHGLGKFSFAIPYAVAFVVLLLGVLTLHKALVPEIDYIAYAVPAGAGAGAPLREVSLPVFAKRAAVGASPDAVLTMRVSDAAEIERARLLAEKAGGPIERTLGIFGVTLLLAGSTVLARVLRLSPRHSRFPRPGANPRVVAALLYVACCVVFWFIPGIYTLDLARSLGIAHEWGQRILFYVFSAVVIAIAHLTDAHLLRRQKPPIWGLRVFMIAGALVVLGLLLPRLVDDWSRNSAALLLGAAAVFLYLWWLATLIFDLAFCWNRYMNQETGMLGRFREQRRQEGEGTDPHEAPLFGRIPSGQLPPPSAKADDQKAGNTA